MRWPAGNQRRLGSLVSLWFVCAGLASAEQEAKPLHSLPILQPVISLRGDTLSTVVMSDAVRADRLQKLAAARVAHEQAPEDVEALIWLGRRTAYIGGYHEAIAIYSQGIALAPEDARLWRHRGHRYISTRQFDNAIADLEHAAALIRGQDDEVEPDGLPNARNIPTSTLQSNIWYHLGLAYFVTGDLRKALGAYEHCLAVSANPDMMVATLHWYYMTLRLLERDDDAALLLAMITADMDIIENEGYHRLLLLYKGEIGEDEVLGDGDALTSATVGYGIATWHRTSGRPQRAREVVEAVLSGSQWAAFGFIAAEADVYYDRR